MNRIRSLIRDNLSPAVNSLKNDPYNLKLIENLRLALNKIFTSKCRDLIVTKNTKLFFGMCVDPIITPELVSVIMETDKKVVFDSYDLEIDDNIFNPLLNLSTDEIIAILLHEIGHVVNDYGPVEKVRNLIALETSIKAKTSTVPIILPIISPSVGCVFVYCIKEMIRKTNSMFRIYKDSEVLADVFVYECGYQKYLNTAFEKILKNGLLHNDSTRGKKLLTFPELVWTINLVTNIKLRRLPALRAVKGFNTMTGSHVLKRNLNYLEKGVVNLPVIEETPSLTKEATSIQEHFKLKYKEFGQSFITERKLYNFDLYKAESDMYEYAMRIRHITDEAEAVYLMKEINMKMSIMNDLLENGKLNPSEVTMCHNLLRGYNKLRDTMASKVKYRTSLDSIVVAVYPTLK